MADTARRFLVGQIVRCPADRGDAGYQGTVTSVGEPLPGKSYRWVEVQHPPRHQTRLAVESAGLTSNLYLHKYIKT